MRRRSRQIWDLARSARPMVSRASRFTDSWAFRRAGAGGLCESSRDTPRAQT
jgi:hypothetical protein